MILRTLPKLTLMIVAALCLADAAIATSPAVKTLPETQSFEGFVPHKALYEIKLAGTKSGSQVVNISGQMFYEWQPSCDAWTSNHRFNLLYEYADAPATHITSDFSTYETFDGRSLNFTSQRKQDGEVFEELRGSATLSEAGIGAAIYSLPKGLEFDLPKGSMFPMAHTQEVMRKIKENKKFFHAVIFDGSDEEGPIEVNTFIGDPLGADMVIEAADNIDKALLSSPSRKVRLAFFPMNDPASTSDYEMSLVLHENGVASDMFIEYEDFSVTQKLVALEQVKGTCDDAKPYNK
jgi:hypothetical protein